MYNSISVLVYLSFGDHTVGISRVVRAESKIPLPYESFRDLVALLKLSCCMMDINNKQTGVFSNGPAGLQKSSLYGAALRRYNLVVYG